MRRERTVFGHDFALNSFDFIACAPQHGKQFDNKRINRVAVDRIILKSLALAVFLVAGTYGASRLGFVSWPAHYDPLALPDLNEAPYWLTQTRLKLIDVDGQNCMITLSRAGQNFAPSPHLGASSNCALEDAVQLSHLSTAKIRTENTRCNIAARLYMWERNVVQPVSKRMFGEGVVEVSHFGAYSCRTISGSTHMSEHATANAFDISGFKFKGGKTISVLKDWENGKNAAFLREVHDGLCNYFNLTLSPDYNAGHKDHFHVDMGWVRGCH
jgi:hypothetical protein